MRILLDTKDLLDLVQRHAPVSLSVFHEYLTSNSAELVLTFTAVREMASPLVDGADVLKVRGIFRKLESLPICYLREATVTADELRMAVTCFEAGDEYRGPCPYVQRWDDTLSVGRELLVKMLVNQSIFDFVYMVYREHPAALKGPSPFGNILRVQFQQDRSLDSRTRKSRK